MLLGCITNQLPAQLPSCSSSSSSSTLAPNSLDYYLAFDIDKVMEVFLASPNWEEKAQCIANQLAQVCQDAFSKTTAVTLSVSPSLDIGKYIDELISKVKSRLYRVNIHFFSLDNRHAFTLSTEGMPCVNIDFSYCGTEEPVSCIAPVIDNTSMRITFKARDSQLSEILFHELGHALHKIEYRMSTKCSWMEKKQSDKLSKLYWANCFCSCR